MSLTSAAEYRTLFAKGKAWADAHLFNGEYYHQLVDLNDRELVAQYRVRHASMVGDVSTPTGTTSTARSSTRSPKAASIDQVLAQWHANLYGLGEIFDPAQVKTALARIFKYNFKQPHARLLQPLPHLLPQRRSRTGHLRLA